MQSRKLASQTPWKQNLTIGEIWLVITEYRTFITTNFLYLDESCLKVLIFLCIHYLDSLTIIYVTHKYCVWCKKSIQVKGVPIKMHAMVCLLDFTYFKMCKVHLYIFFISHRLACTNTDSLYIRFEVKRPLATYSWPGPLTFKRLVTLSKELYF